MRCILIKKAYSSNLSEHLHFKSKVRIMFTNQPPTTGALKKEFIEKHSMQTEFAMLNCAAQMILMIDNPKEVVRIGLQYLVTELSVCRADAGFATPSHQHYTPIAEYCNPVSNPPSITSLVIPNQHPVIQKIWQSTTPVKYESVISNPDLAELKAPLLEAGCKSMLLQRLQWNEAPIGIACIDFTIDDHSWSEHEINFMSSFCELFLGPLAGISNYWYNPKMHSMFSKPTASELKAIQLAANGMSYKQIADELNKSTRTIENQFRNARKRLGAKNQVDLIKKCEHWI